MTTLYKAVRPDGTIQWAPPEGHEGEWIVRHPDGERKPGTHPRTFLSVSTSPTDCIGMRWPCRLLTVEPVEGYPTARPYREDFPHRVVATAWRVTGELPAHEVFGPQGEHVARFIDGLADVPWGTINGDAAMGASDAVLGAARDAAREARDTAWGAASNAASVAVRDAVKEVGWYRDCGTALDAAAAATAALVVRDLIPRETYDILTLPVRLAGITVHPDDPDLTKED